MYKMRLDSYEHKHNEYTVSQGYEPKALFHFDKPRFMSLPYLIIHSRHFIIPFQKFSVSNPSILVSFLRSFTAIISSHLIIS